MSLVVLFGISLFCSGVVADDAENDLLFHLDHKDGVGNSKKPWYELDHQSEIYHSALEREYVYKVEGVMDNLFNSHRERQPRIVGGLPADPGEYPFFAHVANEELCGGSLIYPDIVLTAAHCQDVWVGGSAIIGSTDLLGRDGAEEIDVLELLPHPEYDPATERNDIMMVKLAFPSSNPLLALNTDPALPLDDEQVTVIGFGQTMFEGDVSLELLEVDVTNYNTDVCVENLEQASVFPEEQVCAGELEGGRDSCAGDSGGPLIDLDRSIQYGIVSFGIGCAQPGFPAIYTRVSFYIDFIQQAICDLSDNPPETCPGTQAPTPTVGGTLPPTPATTGVTLAPTTSGGGTTPVPTTSGTITATTTAPTTTGSGGTTTDAPTTLATNLPTTTGTTAAPTVATTTGPTISFDTSAPIATAMPVLGTTPSPIQQPAQTPVAPPKTEIRRPVYYRKRHRKRGGSKQKRTFRGINNGKGRNIWRRNGFVGN